MLLKADQAPGSYWLSARPQFRPGSAAGYGVLRYAGANASALPASPPPQPDTLPPWTLAQLNQVKACPESVSPARPDPDVQVLDPSYAGPELALRRRGRIGKSPILHFLHWHVRAVNACAAEPSE